MQRGGGGALAAAAGCHPTGQDSLHTLGDTQCCCDVIMQIWVACSVALGVTLAGGNPTGENSSAHPELHPVLL
jgi:hypothetical protein